mmetsp:Transcript_23379/g.50904  ORF Transcript_23379/g.50904 Transcript_23379/m.50904 type:complete len:252 (+) Transcript_23379:61-816(+)
MADFPDFPITVLVATTKSGGIAYQGELPWPIDKDVCPFGGIKLPERSAVIMGRKTWSSIPSAYRPLRDHLNVALTSGDPTDFPEGVVVAASFAAALESLQGRVQGAFAIGGSSVFDQAMRLPQCFELQVTTVSEEFKADHFLQPPSGFWPLFQKDVGKSSVTWWRRLQPEVYHQLSFWKETARLQSPCLIRSMAAPLQTLRRGQRRSFNRRPALMNRKSCRRSSKTCSVKTCPALNLKSLKRGWQHWIQRM